MSLTVKDFIQDMETDMASTDYLEGTVEREEATLRAIERLKREDSSAIVSLWCWDYAAQEYVYELRKEMEE